MKIMQNYKNLEEGLSRLNCDIFEVWDFGYWYLKWIHQEKRWMVNLFNAKVKIFYLAHNHLSLTLSLWLPFPLFCFVLRFVFAFPFYLLFSLSLKLTVGIIYCLNPIHDGLFRGFSQRGEGAFWPLSLKSVTHILRW